MKNRDVLGNAIGWRAERKSNGSGCSDATRNTYRYCSERVCGLGVALLAILLLSSASLARANVGRTAGVFHVDQNGGATYTIPLFAPRGPNDLEPQLALVYDSQTDAGYIGVGWSIAGLSAIYRCNQTVAQDGAAAGVALQTSDGYCLDGQRLRLTSATGTYGDAGSTYQTEIANFSQVTAESSAGNGPAYWEVQGKDGRTYEYGNGGNSQVLPGSSSTPYQWWLDKVTDRAGNTMTITYSTANASGKVVPQYIYWTPSSHGASAHDYTMQFSYSTNSGRASQYGYVAGFQVSDTNQLQSITVQYNGTTVKNYVLTDQLSPTTGREWLTAVKECADSGETNCLAPTTFTYKAGQVGVSNTASSAVPNGTIGNLKTHNDFNGDGRSDLAYCNGATIYVAMASPGGYGAPINTGISCSSALYGDLTGSGKDGILAPNGATWWYYTWNGSSFSGQSTGVAYGCAVYSCQYALADVNGDGLPDLLEGEQVHTTVFKSTLYTFYIYVQMNTSSGSSASFSSTIAEWYSLTTGSTPMNAAMISDTDFPYGSKSYGTLKALDFNGDGQDDIVLETAKGSGTPTVNTYEMISAGSSFMPTLITTGTASSWGATTFIDFNSDKCTDYAYNGVIYISACNGSVAQQITLGSGNIVGAIDWDGDGKGDILVQDGTNLGVYLSQGNTIGTLIQTAVPYSSSNAYFSFDATGDWRDLGVLSASVTYYPEDTSGNDLLTGITDGYGNTIQPAYVSLTQGTGTTYTPANSAPSGYEPYTDPIYVVSQVTYSDPSNPPNATFSLTHSYSGALDSITGRGFVGFATHTVLDSRNHLSEEESFDQVFPYIGMVTSDVITDTLHSLTVSSVSTALANQELFSTTHEQVWFPYVSSATRNDYQVYETGGSENGDLITTATSSFHYDTNDDGDLTSSSQTITDNDPGSPYSGYSWSTSVTNTPDADHSTWCLPLLTETQVTYSDTYDNSSITRTRQFTPDLSNCRYTQIQTEPSSGAYEVTEGLGYDAFGNISTDTMTGIGMAARETQANWGTTGQFPMWIEDATGAETQFTYNFSYGVVSSQTDPNGLGTSWAYNDGFGRLTQETRPDSTYTTWSYTLYSGTDPTPRMVMTEQPHDTAGQVISTTTQELDMLDRPYLTQTELIDGSTDTVMQRSYDALGRLVSDQEPHEGGTVGAVTNSYDLLNHLYQKTRTIQSGTATTTYEHAGRTTTIEDANGNTKTLVTDVNGWLRETKDATGYAIILGYDAAGSHVLTTDNQGNGQSNPLWSGTVAYGIGPFTTEATDADLGTWRYTMDALGELIAWTDAKAQNFSAKFDALSRMTDRYEPDLYSHWTWGTSAAAHNIGKLQSACTGTGMNPTVCSSSGYGESETYDSAGRPYQRSITIPADATYTYTQTYNIDGLPDTLTYPVSTSGYALALKYGYAYGLLQSITDTSDSPNVTLWTADTMDAFGQYSKETLGNGVVVNHGFDPFRGLPQSITAGVGGGAALQNNSYLFDAVGNLIERQDINAGTTENVHYDSLNRLSYTVGDTSTQMTYDTLGRIATWEASGASANVNSYTTAQSGCTYYANAQPHAVRASTQGSWPASSYCYDANGNFTTQIVSGVAQMANTWTSFNQPSELGAPAINGYSQLFYDQNHQRYEQIASYSGSLESTEYIGGLLERVSNSSGTWYRYYVPAGNNFIVYSRWVGGTAAFDYATKDNLGTTAVITDQNGALVVSEKYSALGWNENTSAQLSIIAGITRHEFTGQEGLNNAALGAVNMNGRVYQPSGFRFYSPDPRIPNPLNTLDYDRYAYASDNPLTYNDPTGFDAQCGSGGSKCDQDKGDIQEGTPAGPTPPPTVPWPGPTIYVPGLYPPTPTSLMEIYVPGFSGMFPSPFGGAFGSRQTSPIQCTNPGTLAKVGNAIANWGNLMADTSGKLATAGGTVALASGAMGTFVPVTAPVAAFGVAAGLGTAAVGAVGSVVGGAAEWVGGVMSGDLNGATYGILTGVVNAVLAKADAPPLPYGFPDPAQMAASAAGVSPPSGATATCP